MMRLLTGRTIVRVDGAGSGSPTLVLDTGESVEIGSSYGYPLWLTWTYPVEKSVAERACG